ncbi:MAG: hypothetical protein KDC12_02920 [Flavobacteriales bacterium]|nr:hypothetical protein [Flavobacteriales bacterium]
MNKRNFLKSLGVLGVAGAFPGVFMGACDVNGSAPACDRIWTWLGVNNDWSDQELDAHMHMLHDQGVHGVFIGGDNERFFLAAAKWGIEAHLWNWTMNRRDAEIMEHHPEWYAINRLGESCFDKPQYVDYYRWLCPSRPEVLDFLVKEVRAKAPQPYIKGWHLDYIRYCDVILPRALWEKYNIVQNEELPPYDYCYCDTCREKFGKSDGRDPLEIEDPAHDEAWLQFRYDSITHVVNTLAEVVHEYGKPISAAVFPTPTIARKLVRQSWDQWRLDMVFPMLYQGFYNESIEWIGDCVAENVAAVENRMEVYAGLYLPDLTAPSDLANAQKRACHNGARGISLFGGLTEAHWNALKKVEKK